MTAAAKDDLRARLLAIAVHDLRNPLATILGNAEFLVSARELLPESREAAQDLLAGARILARSLTELRTINRGLDGAIDVHLATVDAAALAALALEAAAPHARRCGVTLSLSADGGAPATADRDLLRHVLDDLIDVALRNAPPGTPVDVAVASPPGEVVISVRDRRQPPSTLEMFTLDGDAGGTGGRRLALAFCRLACDAQGARLVPELAPDGAFAVSVRLPRARP